MGRLKAYDETGREVWIKDDYLDNFLEEELWRIADNDMEFDYHFGHVIRKKTEDLIKRIEVLEGELDALRKTKEEKAEEALFISKFVKDNS